MLKKLWILNFFSISFSVEDAFEAAGDTLMAATVCRIIKSKYPNIKLNLITKFPDLVRDDPCLSSLNSKKTYFFLRCWYLETVSRKEAIINVLMETLAKVNIIDYQFKAEVYLQAEERFLAAKRLSSGMDLKPKLAFSTLSKEQVKNWPRENWFLLLKSLTNFWDLIHLGDDREPHFPFVHRFAGRLTMRESMAILSQCDLYVGPDSFLMHAANGLAIKSVILFGGARPASCLGYSNNTNLVTNLDCSPCWLHDSRGDICPHDIKCMKMLTVDQ
jgi:ADP-heptose:LPS heptosyltransferase